MCWLVWQLSQPLGNRLETSFWPFHSFNLMTAANLLSRRHVWKSESMSLFCTFSPFTNLWSADYFSFWSFFNQLSPGYVLLLWHCFEQQRHRSISDKTGSIGIILGQYSCIQVLNECRSRPSTDAKTIFVKLLFPSLTLIFFLFFSDYRLALAAGTNAALLKVVPRFHHIIACNYLPDQ